MTVSTLASTLPGTRWGRLWHFLRQTTPGLFHLLQGSVLVALALFALLSGGYYHYLSATSTTLGKDTVPFLVAAEQVRGTLAEAHAVAVKSFVSEKNAEEYWAEYRDDLDTAHDALLTAAQNTAYGAAVRQPLYEVMSQLARYQELVGAARQHGAYDDHMRQADTLMKTVILPTTVKLDRFNHDRMEVAYTEYRQRVRTQGLFVLLAGVGVLGLLLTSQYVLYRRTKRLLSLPLVLATVAFLFCGVVAGWQTLQSERNLRVAKQDAFDSVHALWKSRAVAAEALTDESQYLLDKGDAGLRDQHLSQFLAKANRVLEVKPEDLESRLASGAVMKGYLGNEMANLTFDGEKDAASTTLRYWNAFRAVDQRLRDVAMGVSSEYTQSEVLLQSELVFGYFDNALDKTLTINRDAFDEAATASLENLDKLRIFLILSVVLALAGTVLGFRPRLLEYRY